MFDEEPDGECRAEIARLAAELAAARAVPADVEAAIIEAVEAACRVTSAELTSHLNRSNAEIADAKRDYSEQDKILRAAIARAIAEARQPSTVGGLLATAPVGSVVEFASPDGVHHQAVVAGGRLLSRRWQHALSHSPGDWTLHAFWLDGDYLRLPARLVPAAEADANPANRGPIGAAPPTNLHPDGCHSTDATATRDCTSDGHHECVSCTRFDAAGRAARGDNPIGGAPPKGG